MFFYFFEDYKEKIYKGSRRKLKWYEVAMIIFLPLSLLLLTLSLSLKLNYIVTILSLVFLILSVMLLWKYTDHCFKRNRDALLAKYKDEHINPLIEILKNYELYTTSGIDWLISCCDNEKNKNSEVPLFKSIKDFFVTLIYPLITLTLGLILKESSSEEVISFTLMFISLFVMIAILLICIKPLVSFILFPDKDIVNYLENELKYIKVFMTKLNS